jgi:hypothetical protein
MAYGGSMVAVGIVNEGVATGVDEEVHVLRGVEDRNNVALHLVTCNRGAVERKVGGSNVHQNSNDSNTWLHICDDVQHPARKAIRRRAKTDQGEEP